MIAQVIIWTGLAVALSFLAGLLFGRSLGRGDIKAKVEEAYQQAKHEAEQEKAEISVEINEQLGKFRDSILRGVEAYQDTVKIVTEKLAGNSLHIQKLAASKPFRLEHVLKEAEVPSSLELVKDSEDVAPLPTNQSSAIEDKPEEAEENKKEEIKLVSNM